MAIGPDPRDLAAKAALAKRYGATDAWGNRIGGDEEPDEGAYSLAKRLVAQDLVRQGKAPSVEAAMGAYAPLDRLDQMLGKNPLDREGELFARRQAASMAPMQPRDGVIPRQGPMSQAIDAAGLRQKRDAAWRTAVLGPQASGEERQHAPGMEPEPDGPHEKWVKAELAKEAVAGSAGNDFVQKVGFAKQPDMTGAVAHIDPRVQNDNPSGLQTKAGAEAIRHMALREDPQYQAAIAARKANAQLPLDQQVPMPVRTSLPPSTDRYGQRDPNSLGSLLRSQVPALRDENGMTGGDRLKAREDASWAMIQDRARLNRMAKDSGIPPWMVRGAEQNWMLSQDRTNLARENATNAASLQAQALKQQGDLAREEFALRREQMGQGRDDKLREERLQAQAAAMAAQRKADELNLTSPGSFEAKQAQAAADQASQFHRALIGEIGGPKNQPVPGAIPGVQSGAAAPGPMTSQAAAMTGLPPRHWAAMKAAKEGGGSDYDQLMRYLETVGPEVLDNQSIEAELLKSFSPGAIKDAKIHRSWGLDQRGSFDAMGPNSPKMWNYYTGGIPRMIHQGLVK